MRMLAKVLAITFATMVCGSASAHVVLETRTAPVGSFYKATFAVPHGCAGSPTTEIRVTIPEGVIAVKPMPKQGWMLDVVKGVYSASYAFHGQAISEGVEEIVWRGGNLSDDYYDEFVMTTYLTEKLPAGSTLYFPVIQTCASGVSRWIETPPANAGVAGHDHDHDHGHGGLAFPAPGVKLTPAE